MLTTLRDVMNCDGCGAFFGIDAPDATSAWFGDRTFVDFCSEQCAHACFARGGTLHGGRGTLLLIGRRTPAEWLAGVTNHGPEADVDLLAWLR